MKPNFALDLSQDGIVLLHRAPNGHWTEVGNVKLDDPGLSKNLSYLRSTAVALEGKGFASKLILPNSEILYREINAPGPTQAERDAQIKQALEGATRYDVADLTYDWLPEGATVKVAVVANVTLDEAESFAVEHRFNPVSFVGRESAEPGAWQPFFGRTDYSFAFLGADAEVRDTPAPALLQDASENLFAEDFAAEEAEPPVDPEQNIFAPESEAVPDPVSQPEPEAPPEQPEPAAPIPPFSSRRHNPETAAAVGIDPDQPRPLERVTPRIAIAPEPELTGPDTNATGTDSTIPEPPAAAEATAASDSLAAAPAETPPQGGTPGDRNADLRRAIMGADEPPGAKARGAGRAAGLLRAMLKKSSPEGGNSAGHNSGGRGPSAIKSLAARATQALGSMSQAIRNRQKTGPRPRIEPTFSQPPSSEGAESDSQDSDPGAATKRVRLGLVAAVLVLALVGGLSLWQMRGTQKHPSSPRTTAQKATPQPQLAVSRGRARTPPPSRPTRLAKRLASSSAPTKPIRPARRSVFEGRTDPNAKLPDTAAPVTTLSEQELADIRAAGLNTPTPEELADATGNRQQKSAAEVAAAYKATGALQQIRIPPAPEANPQREDIYVASVDRPLEANDAIILPDFSNGVGELPPPRVLSPLDPGISIKTDANGLVKPSPKGTLNPDGILVRAGKPPVFPPKKPETAQLVPPNPLAALKPKPRPATLKTGADAIYVQGKLTLTQLRKLRAKPRPPSFQQLHAATGGNSPSALAVLTSLKPSRRPSDFSKIVRKVRVKLALANAAKTPKRGTTRRFSNVGPNIPTRASVARRATVRNAINLSRLNLIGVYGTPSRRSALLRLPSGRFVKVRPGDRVAGGKIAAIGTSSISYVKSGRNRVLKIPN